MEASFGEQHLNVADPAPAPAGPCPSHVQNAVAAPFDRFFEQLDVWKLLAVIGAMVIGIATFHNYNLVSNGCMRARLLMLCFAFFLLSAAKTLQDMAPRVALGAMLTGIALVIASFHTVLQLLDPPQEMMYLAIFALVVGYAALLSLTLLKIVKEYGVCVEPENEIARDDDDDMV